MGRAHGDHREEISHHHHRTDVGTVQGDERTNVVNPITNIASNLEHQLGVRVTSLNGGECIFRHRLNLAVNINKLIGSENHHSAHQHKKEQAGHNTDLN